MSYIYPNEIKALNNINLNIFKGEMIAIMGKNGAGKTTLIRTLNGLIRPSSGNIYFENQNINLKTIATLSKKIGIVFQNPLHQLFANSIEEEIRFSLKSLNLRKEEMQFKIDQVLKQYDLEKYRTKSPLNLSGGESKKLAIASIICRNPDVLIFDEPTLGQDEKEMDFFINFINNQRKQEKTIIIVTHNIEFAYEFIPRTILMAEGEIIADGPTKKVLRNIELVHKTSLILPQIYQLCLALKKSGFQGILEINSKNKMIEYLRTILREKLTKTKEEII